MNARGAMATQAPAARTVVGSVAFAGAGYAAAWARAQVEVQAARRAACRDALTGLANRTALTAAGPRLLDAAARRGVPAGVVLVDLVGFKAVNDTHGHLAGDAVLVAVAARLTGSVGRGGLAVRLGGDEFAAITLHPRGGEDATGRWLSEWLDAAHELLTQPVVCHSRELVVGATLGAVPAGPGQGLSVLLARADAAMYAARAAGAVVHLDGGVGPVGVPQPRPALRRRDAATNTGSRTARYGLAGGAR